jgi:threonine aldolase
MTINLISDTITKPTPEMLACMMAAEVGDDVFKTDPTTNALESYVAELFGHEAAIFCPSGTMTNQIAIKLHTEALDELICDVDSHVYQYETGGYGFNSGIAVNLIQGKHGKITADLIIPAIKADQDWLPKSALVVLENSCNKGGGSFYTIQEIEPISQLCRSRGIAIHLDGARLFNVLVETGETPAQYGALFDTISICISKGLGAPIGSLLLGSKTLIKKARRFRKVMGGGMRQTGYIAAACHYALTHHVDRLKIDNDRAKAIGALLSTLSYVDYVKPVHTNIVIFKLKDDIKDIDFLDRLKAQGIIASPFGDNTIRFVFHLDISDEMYEVLQSVLPRMS